MAQLRKDYGAFVERCAEIVVVGPEDMGAFRRQWEEQSYPFVGLADPDHSVADRYGQQVKWLKLGRMPALVVIDRSGQIRYKHYGESMRGIVSSDQVIGVLDALNSEPTVAHEGLR